MIAVCFSPLVLPRGWLGRGNGGHGWHRDGSRGDGQVIAGGLETVLAGRVVHGAPLAVGVHVAVRTASVAVSVRFLFELGPVALFVSGAELPVVGEIPGIRQDGGVLLADDKRHRRQRHQDEYLIGREKHGHFFNRFDKRVYLSEPYEEFGKRARLYSRKHSECKVFKTLITFLWKF